MGCVCGSGDPRNIKGTYADDDAKEVKEEDIIYVPDIWAVFTYKKKLGAGATADVTLVSHQKTNVLYALKMVSKRKSKHFDRERKILKRLESPNIIRLVDVYEDDRRHYLSMEYCSGESLIARTANKDRYSESGASNTVQMILKALKYIHDMDIVHRDLKPENFVYLSDSDAGLKMLDFGLAMDVLSGEKYAYRAGTPYYMAPEVVKNNKKRSAAVCKKSDVWSIGVCLYILLNGTAPFKGNSRDELFKAILHKKIKFEATELTSDAKDLVRKMIETDPEKRFSVDEALAHPWILRRGERENEIMRSTVQALRWFNSRNCVTHALEKATIASMDDFDEEAIKQIFNLYDKDGDGNITKEECISALEDRQIYRQKAEEIATDMIRNADENNDKLIQFNEFKAAMVRHQLSQDEYRMHAIFSTLDSNKDGHISIDELVHCLPDSDDGLIQKIKARFKEADTDNDDQLSFDEFTNLLTVNQELKETTMAALDREEDMVKQLDDNEQFVDKLVAYV